MFHQSSGTVFFWIVPKQRKFHISVTQALLNLRIALKLRTYCPRILKSFQAEQKKYFQRNLNTVPTAEQTEYRTGLVHRQITSALYRVFHISLFYYAKAALLCGCDYKFPARGDFHKLFFISFSSLLKAAFAAVITSSPPMGIFINTFHIFLLSLKSRFCGRDYKLPANGDFHKHFSYLSPPLK